jgi:uncharacterized protein (UPF0332 family)
METNKEKLERLAKEHASLRKELKLDDHKIASLRKELKLDDHKIPFRFTLAYDKKIENTDEEKIKILEDLNGLLDDIKNDRKEKFTLLFSTKGK